MKNKAAKLIHHLYKLISSPYSIVFVIVAVVVWFVVGIFVRFSSSWFSSLEGFAISLTLIMTFVIEHDQRVDTRALHEKLDELIKSQPRASNKKIRLEKRYKGEKF